MGQRILSRGCGPMPFCGVTALYLDFQACSFPYNSSYSFDPVKLKLCKYSRLTGFDALFIDLVVLYKFSIIL